MFLANARAPFVLTTIEEEPKDVLGGRMSTEKSKDSQSKQQGTGLEKPPPESEEVAGHTRKYETLNCVHCGALNYYTDTWHLVTCWVCSTQNFP
jgi:hypothetical protein